MWCLARMLPLMIGKDISVSDEHWSNYLVLLEMLDYVFAPTLTCEAVAQLKVLIDDHHHTFKVLYPNSPITPKMHYIVRYPDLILRLSFSSFKVHVHVGFLNFTGMDLLCDCGA